jgi:hypothetical protein
MTDSLPTNIEPAGYVVRTQPIAIPAPLSNQGWCEAEAEARHWDGRA